MDTLSQKRCIPCEGKTTALTKDKISEMIQQTPGWSVDAELKSISRRFEFKGFAKTIAFVNALAWVATSEGHHPDVHFGFNYCMVHFSTHAADGLTENDFICAAKVNRLME